MPILFFIGIIVMFTYLFTELYRHRRLSLVTDIYYDTKTNLLFQVKSADGTTLTIGGLCEFYGDAKTTITRQKVSPDFLKGCIPITNCDKYSFLVMDRATGSWRVK